MSDEMRKAMRPVDPDCPGVIAFHDALFGDPLTHAMGAPTDDICEDFEWHHRATCPRCQAFGAANIEVAE